MSIEEIAQSTDARDLGAPQSLPNPQADKKPVAPLNQGTFNREVQPEADGIIEVNTRQLPDDFPSSTANIIEGSVESGAGPARLRITIQETEMITGDVPTADVTVNLALTGTTQLELVGDNINLMGRHLDGFVYFTLEDGTVVRVGGRDIPTNPSPDLKISRPINENSSITLEATRIDTDAQQVKLTFTNRY